jgi:hypothetical protein
VGGWAQTHEQRIKSPAYLRKRHGDYHPQMKNGRVFPVAMPGELQITPLCAPQRMDAEIPAAVPRGGSLRERVKTQVALRDRIPVCLRPRLAECMAAD